VPYSFNSFSPFTATAHVIAFLSAARMACAALIVACVAAANPHLTSEHVDTDSRRPLAAKFPRAPTDAERGSLIHVQLALES
jgi:hypothetical protein